MQNVKLKTVIKVGLIDNNSDNGKRNHEISH